MSETAEHSTLGEYKRKTPLRDGKPKVRIWVVSVLTRIVEGDDVRYIEQMVALFSDDEERAEAFRARYGYRGRKHRWLVDAADERIEGERDEFMTLLREWTEEIDPAEEKFLRDEFEKSLHEEEE